ncbi:hypothetical protein BaRGS_00017660 [Batillaria attramentaria]|uniref:Uncharacterized protein n=1 Tax=Batillaria attramentaria TaxID=370345 RepID=A0ABD0KUY4_9CAEN
MKDARRCKQIKQLTTFSVPVQTQLRTLINVHTHTDTLYPTKNYTTSCTDFEEVKLRGTFKAKDRKLAPLRNSMNINEGAGELIEVSPILTIKTPKAFTQFLPLTNTTQQLEQRHSFLSSDCNTYS